MRCHLHSNSWTIPQPYPHSTWTCRELEPEGLALDAIGALRVIPTPGHTLDSVSLVVSTAGGQGVVVVAGDLFEREEDLLNQELWREAGSEDEEEQEKSRVMVLAMADWVVPGHGPMFWVGRGNPR